MSAPTTTQTDTPQAPGISGGLHTTYSVLLEALKATGLAIPLRTPMKALGGVWITSDSAEFTAGSATLQTYDMDLSVRYDLPGTIHVGDPIRVLVSHTELAKLLPALTKGVAKRESVDLPVSITQDGADVSVNLNGYTMPLEVLPTKDYPTLPARPDTAAMFGVSELVENVERVSVALDNDSAVPVLRSVLFRIQDGELTLAATDRYRLTVATMRVDSGDTDFTGLVPGHFVKLVRHLDAGQVGKVGFDEHNIVLAAGNVTFIQRLADGQFPKYKSLVPGADKIGVTYRLDRAKVLLAAERAAAVLAAKGKAGRQVAIDVAADCISVRPVPIGEEGKVRAPWIPAEELMISADRRHSTILVSVNFLVAALKNFTTDKVALHVQDEDGHKPVLFTAQVDGVGDPTAYRHLLMVVRPAAG
jgi:DNA polymerase-3 subunit beta